MENTTLAEICEAVPEREEPPLWNGHFSVRLSDTEVKRFRWQHYGRTIHDAHATLRAAVEREYPDAVEISCHVLPAYVLPADAIFPTAPLTSEKG